MTRWVSGVTTVEEAARRPCCAPVSLRPTVVAKLLTNPGKEKTLRVTWLRSGVRILKFSV